ncbi:glutamate racemase [Crenobacter intestini]|uniref:Glutamate racemase n=1 Tax=Crenobacter intestini TaxID=2563443 RepID=A0A4T0UTF0_9NEIS|nr:glutamate racemase [Crenobacter intestini]TIC82128.1 glutamate racemase [Crenobacter intestini]
MIGMFDSGLGGLSVWRELTRQLPDEPVIYFADRAWCPYGPRSHQEIAARSERIARWLFDQGASSLVIACNTATSAAAAPLRARYPHVPIIGMEPAIKPAALATETGEIAVLATRATLAGDKLEQLAARYRQQARIRLLPGDGFVEAVEAGELDTPNARQVVARALSPLAGTRTDQIVLGCTHYPFLAPLIAEAAPQATLIDPASAVCRQVHRLIALNALETPASEPPRYRFVTTAGAPDMQAFIGRVLGRDARVETLALD